MPTKKTQEQTENMLSLKREVIEKAKEARKNKLNKSIVLHEEDTEEDIEDIEIDPVKPKKPVKKSVKPETDEKKQLLNDNINDQMRKLTEQITKHIETTIYLHLYQVERDKIAHIEVVEDMYHLTIETIKNLDLVRELFLKKAILLNR